MLNVHSYVIGAAFHHDPEIFFTPDSGVIDHVEVSDQQ